LEAAEALAREGIEAEVLDLRSLVPLDRESILRSVAKTGHLVVVDEDYRSYGLTAEVITTVVEHDLSLLRGKPERVAYPDIPVPYSRPMEQFALPDAEKIAAAARRTLATPAVA
ncbi:MAG: transketolase C-terminal domain-containing protein, partial [Bacillota bacterium]|nr:transketolase C-terminal domain-containing protein [Bacillota bacterium]